MLSSKAEARRTAAVAASNGTRASATAFFRTFKTVHLRIEGTKLFVSKNSCEIWGINISLNYKAISCFLRIIKSRPICRTTRTAARTVTRTATTFTTAHKNCSFKIIYFIFMFIFYLCFVLHYNICSTIFFVT